MNTGEGLKINSYINSPNIKISFKQSDEKDNEITVPFIKSPTDTAKILKEKSDAVLITYTAYENSALLFKSTEVPVIIIDDGNRNIKKISESDKTILKSGIQYDLQKYKSFEELLNEFTGLDEIKNAIENFEIEKLQDLINSLLNEDAQSLDLLNLPGLFKAYMRNTTDRKKYSALKEIFQNFYTKIIFNPTTELKSSIKIILALHNNSCCTILKQAASPSAEKFIDDYNESNLEDITLNTEQNILGKRIIEDRIRLNKLLSMFYKEINVLPSFAKIEKEMSLLKNEISIRKDVYNSEFYSIKSSKIKKQPDKSILEKDHKQKGLSKKITIPAAILILILIVSAFYFFKYRINKTTGIISESELKPVENKNIVITVKRVNEEEKDLLLKHKVKISESDIYKYSNDVAVKNGYSKLSYSGLKNKNPHWIFPANIFIMLDGEKVVVQKGDTLWDLARAKLEKMNADFYKIIDEIEKTDTTDKNKINTLITEAEKYSYIKQQIQILNIYKKRIKDE